VDEHSPTAEPSEVSRIDGLPSSEFGAFDPGFWQRMLRQRGNSEQSTEAPPATNGNHEADVPSQSLSIRIPTIVTSQTSPDSYSVPRTPPTYDQVANEPPGQSDSPHLSHRQSISMRLSSLPPSAFQISAERGSARLSPSVITRHPPLPIIALPRLRALETREPVSAPKPRVGLRNVPALARQGPDAYEPYHEIGNSDDEEDFPEVDEEPGTSANLGSEDEDDMTTPETDISVNRVGTSPNTKRYSNASSINTDDDPRLTPTTRLTVDYFSSVSQQPQRLSSQAAAIEWDTNHARPMSLLHTSGSSRLDLAMNSRASRSTGDLITVVKHDLPPIIEDRKGKGKAKDVTPTNSLGRRSTSVDIESRPSVLRRRRSLPTFTESSEPPPYPSFGKARRLFMVQPREEEGMEKLPPYTNGIYLSALLPRKVEFTAPGVQSKDRKWRRSLCILEGTAFKIFHPPQGAAGMSALGQWWERRVGVGDVVTATPAPIPSKAPPVPRKDEEPLEDPIPTPVPMPQESSSAPFTKKKRQIAPGFLSRSNLAVGSSPTRHSVDIPREERGPPRARRSLSISRSNQPTTPTSSTSTPNAPSSIMTTHGTANSSVADTSGSSIHLSGSDRRAAEQLAPNPKDLIRLYTLQRAESGLANDYHKRKNVIRVRMEGEQFLLQAPDVSTVVEWVEVHEVTTVLF
jgi:hypothetical protein